MSSAVSLSPIECLRCLSARQRLRQKGAKSRNPVKTYFIEFSYLLASMLFILGLRGMSHPETARRGMHLAEFGMVTAVIGTLLQREIISYEWIIAGLLLGSTIGLMMGIWVPMT